MLNDIQRQSSNVIEFPVIPRIEAPMLSPAQQVALSELERLVALSPLVYAGSLAPIGKTTVLKAFAGKVGAKFIDLKDLVDVSKGHDTRLSHSAVVEAIERLLSRHEIVVLDSLMHLFSVHSGPRSDPHQGVTSAHMDFLFDLPSKLGKRLVVGGWVNDGTPMALIKPLDAEDYAAIIGNIIGHDRANAIDFKLIHQFSSMLNGHELRMAGQALSSFESPSTDDLVDVLERYVLATNIRVNEIEALSFDSLPGAEHITSKLETHVVMPLENRELAMKLGLRPKRGVLLHGPPGTGKTSIGRALAHRMKGKFFLIDGSIVTEPPGAFFGKLHKVVHEAKKSSPSVLFIDDADVLFDIVHISGLGRYLLTLLDGLESESASHVCVMMTAMDVRKVPEALLRSGRVELWLETRPPQGGDRGRVLQRWLGNDLPRQDEIDYEAFSDATEGCTPADLRRIAGDAKCLYAADLAKGREPVAADEYLRRAVSSLFAVRARMADVMQDESIRLGKGATRTAYGLGVGGMAEMGAGCKTRGWDF